MSEIKPVEQVSQMSSPRKPELCQLIKKPLSGRIEMGLKYQDLGKEIETVYSGDDADIEYEPLTPAKKAESDS